MIRKLIKNANVFDGNNPKLIENASLIIEDELITAIEQEHISEESFDEVIDAKGHTALPGLTDAHVHVSITANQEPLPSG